MKTSTWNRECHFLARALIVAGFFLIYVVTSSAQGILPPPNPNFLLDSWSFNDTSWISDLGDSPLNFTNLNNSSSFDGNALQVDTNIPAFLQYNIVDNAVTNLTFPKGTIEFWVLPDWNSGTGPGDWGRLIDVGAYSTNILSSWWALYFSPDGMSINFSSETNGVFTNYLSYPISWDTNTWHMIDLTYVPFRSQLYIDGQLATNGSGSFYIPSVDVVSNGFFVGSDVTGQQQSRALIDDLATYNFTLSGYEISNDYAAGLELMGGGGFHPDDGGPIPPGGGGGTGGTGGGSYAPPDYGTNLWLQITNATNGFASGWIHNSSIFVPYTFFSRPSLVWPIWSPETTFYGSWSTNLTAFMVSMLARSNLFVEARSQIAPRIVGGGNTHFSALRRDGTVWAWGNGDAGQLGDGDWTNTATPVQVIGLSNVVAITAPPTADYTLALDKYGKVWGWGTNGNGQLGRHDELYTNENTPAVIPGLSNITAIAGGSGHAMALKSDGTVWTWGDNAYGDLGNGTNVQRDYAAPVAGLTNAVAIASGDSHCLVLCSDDAVWGWGLNEDWELGIGNATDQWRPCSITSLTNVAAIGCGYVHSIALLGNGTIEAWGVNYLGEIGDISSSTPVPVPGLSNVVSIACGGWHNLFINTNGSLMIWGADWAGQFGDDGADDGDTSPYLVTSVSNVTAIAGGVTSTIISTGNGHIYTWGDSYEYEPSPTLVDLYTNYSSDGSGLADWWELQYFHHLGLDPSSDPVGDGWTLLQDYEQGYNPTNFITPPAITGLTVTQTNGESGVALTWSAETPTPLDYAIYRIDFNYDTWEYGTTQQIGEVAGNVTTFTDNGSVAGGDQNSIYEAVGIYGGGTSPVSAEAFINSTQPPTLTDNLPFTTQLVRNGTGRWQIMFSGLPTGLQTIRLYWYDSSYLSLYALQYWGPVPEYTTQDITVSNLVNGVYSISDSDVINELGDSLVVQGIGPSSLQGQLIFVGGIPVDAPYFVDGRQHMEQNLKFLIRGANIDQPYGGEILNGNFQEFAIPYVNSTNFDEFSFIHHDNTLYSDFGPNAGDFYTMDNLWPFQQNYWLSDWILEPATGRTFGKNNFNFTPNFATNVPAPAILNQSDPVWIVQNFGSEFTNQLDADVVNFGVLLNDSFTQAAMESGLKNLDGLSFESGIIYGYNGTNNFQELDPGATIDLITNFYNIFGYASWCPAPTLNFTNYYLAPIINPYGSPGDLPPGNGSWFSGAFHQPYPLPIDVDISFPSGGYSATCAFSVTNQTPPVMFGSVGQPMILGAWAKYSVQGSSPTKYAYLGQYFTTNAFEVDSDGNITTTNAGTVSPYGEFFPTQPGPVALITMTNLDTGTHATGIVNVISLALDANHDGTIDPTWNGPDYVSQSRPFVFWLNNNYDRTNWDIDDATFYEDDVASNSVSAYSLYTGQPVPDSEYRDSYGNRIIPTERDLEDYARLWICGLTSNLVSSLPSGSTVTLSWGDIGSPNPNNPTIDLFTAGDADGGNEYLTNESSASEQVDPVFAPYIKRLGPGDSIQLNSFLYNGWAGNHFIWCGVTNGAGTLTLTITDANSNILAQTSTYIQLEDIKQMYERWTVGENPAVVPTTVAQLATNDLPQNTSPFRYDNPPNANTPFILFVHGWNMETWEKDRFGETAFKRLYWQGYQGRFGIFRWPTDNGFQGLPTVETNLDEADNFDNSEYQAWRSAQGLLNKLNDLNSQYPGRVYVLAHSMGNVVTGEALRLAETNEVVNTYVASQAAVSAHTYDETIPNYSFTLLGISFGPYTPNIYGDWFAGNSGDGAGSIVSFYNTNDFALSRNHWQFDQLLKPDQDVLENGDRWYYSYDGSSSDPYPWNNFLKEDTNSTTLYFNIVTSLGNRYEVMSYAAQAYTTALGATAGVGNLTGSIYLGRTANPIWPTDPTGDNYTEHFWHSAEFRGDYPMMQGYWNELLSTEAFNLR